MTLLIRMNEKYFKITFRVAEEALEKPNKHP
jgi:hypothetical protein